MKRATLTMQVDIVKASKADIRHTGLIGYLEATYEEICREIGEPWRDGERGDKIDAEWAVMAQGMPDTVLTIYNYKDGKNYLGDQGHEVERIIQWHLGGRGKAAMEIALALFHERVTPA